MGPSFTSASPLRAGRVGSSRLMSELLPSSTAMTGAILGRQLDPGSVATLLDDLSTAGALVSSEGPNATFLLDQAAVAGFRAYPKVATLTTLELAALAHQGLLIEVSLYRGRREIFRGRFEEPHPPGDLVNIIDRQRGRRASRRAALVRGVRAAGAWLYTGLRWSGACFGWAPEVAETEEPRGV